MISDTILRELISAGLSQRDLAQRMGVHEVRVHQILTSQNVTVRTLGRIADALGKELTIGFRNPKEGA